MKTEISDEDLEAYTGKSPNKRVFPCAAKYVYPDGHFVVKPRVYEENVRQAEADGVKVEFLEGE